MNDRTAAAYARLVALGARDDWPLPLLSDIRLVCAELRESQRAYAQLYDERRRDITEYKRVLAKLEAVSVAHANQAMLLARIEELAREAGCQAVVEACVRRGE